ncbi:MAG: hypothetical protein H7Y39_06840 [Nitrospiraceae bacterium]|nr:hypothetical protein [Nitrospiraceae bacterium]
MHVYRHPTNDARYDREMATMAGSVRFAAESKPDESQRFWSDATLGDLETFFSGYLEWGISRRFVDHSDCALALFLRIE